MYCQLITPEQLSAISQNENLIILDASIPPIAGMSPPRDCWPEISIENARQFNLKKDFSDTNNPLPHSMPSEQQFSEQARKLGINKNSQIVVYDHFGIFSSARVWWMFKSMGHNAIAVLNGGLPEWIKTGYTTTPAISLSVKGGDFIGRYQAEYFCNSEDVLQAIESDFTQIVDARSSGRFLGVEVEPRAGMRSGHMPSAVNLHYQTLQESGCLIAKDKLANCFIQAGVEHASSNQNTESYKLIMTCGSGVTACILALAADILGYKNIQVYDGSWSEWGANSIFPVTK